MSRDTSQARWRLVGVVSVSKLGLLPLGILKDIPLSLYENPGGGMSENPPIEFVFLKLPKSKKGAAPTFTCSRAASSG